MFSDDEKFDGITFDIQISMKVSEDTTLADTIQIKVAYSKADHDLPRFEARSSSNKTPILEFIEKSGP